MLCVLQKNCSALLWLLYYRIVSYTNVSILCSYGAVVAPPHRIGEERKSEHQTTTVKELAKLTNPHEVQVRSSVFSCMYGYGLLCLHLIAFPSWLDQYPGQQICCCCKDKRAPARPTLVVHGLHHMQKWYKVRQAALQLQEHHL